MKIQIFKVRVFILAAMIFILAVAGAAQTTDFTYQGRFIDSTVPQPTNGTYDMHFALFDAISGGNQVGATVNIPAVQIVNGIFTVTLDYTAASFDGSARFLQVTVGNTALSPRQAITSAPYAITARNALQANNSNQLGGISLVLFPRFSGKPETPREKTIVMTVFAVGVLLGLYNWHLIDPKVFTF